jgi:hypothetical protein
VPAGSAAALICDTVALIDYVVEGAPDHRLFRNAIDQARAVTFLVSCSPKSITSFATSAGRCRYFMQDLARGAFTYAPPTVGQLSRAMEVDRRFEDLALALVDGSIVALAESRHPRSGYARRAALCRRSTPRWPPVRVGGSPTDPDKS